MHDVADQCNRPGPDTYTFLDDWTYLEGGKELFFRGIGITNILEHLDLVKEIGGGSHILYYLYNSYAFKAFGYGYYSPVALNILLTIVIAFFGARLASRGFGLGEKTSNIFYFFLLLYPDILAWSTVMNGKDILVLFFQVILLVSISEYWYGKRGRAILISIPVLFLLFFLRFYIPVFFSVAVLLSLTTFNRKYFLYNVFFAFTVFFIVFYFVGFAGFQYALDSIRDNFSNPLYGAIRFLLTPIPFNTEVAYEFLDFPALLHWLFFPFVIFGFFEIIKNKSFFVKFFIIFLLLQLCLYSIYLELQGPRHRVQLDYFFAIMQFIGIMNIARILKRRQTFSLSRFSA